jgi:hypothetical protein
MLLFASSTPAGTLSFDASGTATSLTFAYPSDVKVHFTEVAPNRFTASGQFDLSPNFHAQFSDVPGKMVNFRRSGSSALSSFQFDGSISIKISPRIPEQKADFALTVCFKHPKAEGAYHISVPKAPKDDFVVNYGGTMLLDTKGVIPEANGAL